jgi:pSer/pThr/pTyr-binding forkhead associated (FHA) protein
MAPPPAPAAPVPPAAPAVGADGRRALAGFFVSFQDDALGKFWPLYQGANKVGRADTGQKMDVYIAHRTTSTDHALVEIENARATVVDKGSTNGTYHNEEAIGYQGRRELRDGDRLRFGGFSVYVFLLSGRM